MNIDSDHVELGFRQFFFHVILYIISRVNDLVPYLMLWEILKLTLRKRMESGAQGFQFNKSIKFQFIKQ